MPNILAYIALLGWPLIAIAIFAGQKSIERAIIWSVVGSFLFLPSSFEVDLPFLPPLDKVTVPNLTLLALVLLKTIGRPTRFRPESVWVRLLLLLLLVSPLLTATFNGDPVNIGTRTLPPMTYYDAFSDMIRTVLAIAVPFLVGRRHLASVEAHRMILLILMAAGLVYSVMMVMEVRLSPQFHNWVYGYFPHSFMQQMRGDGFRPVVFLRHGLWVAFFAMTITVAAAVLWRDARSNAESQRNEVEASPKFYIFVTMWFGLVLALCKSFGSGLYGLALTPIVMLLKPRTQLRIATALVVIAVTYPALRSASLVPLDTIMGVAESVSDERAFSLQVRLTNEEILLDRASERPLFGWGGWGRNRDYDPWTGADLSTTDGFWIITFGMWGWVGYVAVFGLLAAPVLAVRRRIAASNIEVSYVTAGLCLLLAINMIELLPNSMLQPWTWLIAGAILGFAENPNQRLSAAEALSAARRRHGLPSEAALTLEPAAPRRSAEARRGSPREASPGTPRNVIR